MEQRKHRVVCKACSQIRRSRASFNLARIQRYGIHLPDTGMAILPFGELTMPYQTDLYERSQFAIAELKSVVFQLLEQSAAGRTNAEIGRSLGIYAGHIGHEGHIPRTILALMQADGSVIQDGKGGKWYVNVDGKHTLDGRDRGVICKLPPPPPPPRSAQ